jgi:hypothetical protein
MKTSPGLIAVITAIGFACVTAFSQEVRGSEAASLRAKYDEKVWLDVLRPHELAVADLNAKFISALERSQDVAQKSGKLEEAIAIKTERDAVLAGNYKPAADVANTSIGLKTLRATYRTSLSKLELDRDKRLRPYKDAMFKALDEVIVSLTKSGKLEEAMAAKKLREDVLTSTDVMVSPPGKDASVVVSDKIFVNSLGMKFVSVKGTGVLFCIHETRRQDYATYAAENPSSDAAWKNQKSDGIPVGDKNDTPVVSVNLEDAQKFCSWLTQKEGKRYRLPTDKEWSLAVGIGSEENATKRTMRCH